MKQASRASSGGEIYKLGHRIITLKASTIILSQESPILDRRGKSRQLFLFNHCRDR